MTESADALRVDSWLWRARFFRTRSLAAAAVDAGHVRVNGARVRRSRCVRPGDPLEIVRPADTLVVSIAAIPARRGPASEAAASCQVEQREARERTPERGAGARRPDRRERRQLRELRGR